MKHLLAIALFILGLSPTYAQETIEEQILELRSRIEQLEKPPLHARVMGIATGQQDFTQSYKRIIWGSVDYDTGPARGDNTIVVLNGTTGLPSGNFIIRKSGFWRFNVKTYWTPQQSSLSLYVALNDAGLSGSEIKYVDVGNNNQLAGYHPSVLMDLTIEVDLGADPFRYFNIHGRWINSALPLTQKYPMQTLGMYVSAEVSYVGPLTSQP